MSEAPQLFAKDASVQRQNGACYNNLSLHQEAGGPINGGPVVATRLYLVQLYNDFLIRLNTA